MRKRFVTSPKLLMILATGLLISLLLPRPAEAAPSTDPVTFEELGNQLKDISVDLTRTANDVEAKRKALTEKVGGLELQIQNQEISITEAESRLKELKEINALTREREDELQEKYDLINENYEKYVFQTRAEAVVPFIYAIAAIAASDGENDDKALHGLAGYGVGSLIENTGFGIAKGITYLKYEVLF